MKVIEPRQRPEVESQSRGFVAALLADDFETRDKAEARQKPPVEVPAAAPSPAPTPAPAAKPKDEPRSKPARLYSLDAFRGLTVILMLVVNNIALDTYTPDSLTHAGWGQSLHLADYVFPWFLLCVGLSIPFSFASFKKKGLPSWRMDLRIISRTVALIFLGCLINAAISHQVVFTLGVLQLIGLAYFVAAYSYELPIVRRAILATLMLAGYGLAIKFLPFPGSPIGTFDENANFIDHINKSYLLMYNLDGLFSTIPTAALMIYASLIGDALLHRRFTPLSRLAVMAVSGGLMVGAGILINFVIPYSKPIWTPSYILLTGGVGILVLAGFYLFTDAVKWGKWAFPLMVFGSNAILAYVMPVLCKVMMFSTWTIHTAKGAMTVQDACLSTLVEKYGRLNGGWAYTVSYIVFWWLILALLYRKRAFLRV